MIECKAKCPIFVVEDLLVLNGGMGARGFERKGVRVLADVKRFLFSYCSLCVNHSPPIIRPFI